MEEKIIVVRETDESEKKVLDLAAAAGHVLLENGAEIFRVEETMSKIAHAYGMKGDNSFVLSSGIFLTEETSNHSFYARVKHIPLNSIHLEKVALVNQLSRKIAEGCYTVDEAMAELQRISSLKDEVTYQQLIAYGLGSAGFCYLFGGSLKDTMSALLCGVLLYCFIRLFRSRKKSTSKIVLNILCSGFVSVVSILLWKFHIGDNLNHIIIGSIMPLLPGVAFTNAIRDLANEDYISGTVRMVDAILVATCIAIGVGIVFTIYTRISGGIMI